MNQLKVYDVILREEDFGLQAISFVDEPAIEQDFIYFNGIKPLMFAVQDKQEVISPVLIPEQLIYRIHPTTKEEFYIKWSAESIEQVAVKFLLDQATNNTTIMHPTFSDSNLKLSDVLVDDVYMKRMWIIEDKNKDEANTKYGYDLPVGTLMVHYKIHNQGLWQRIKKGELKGLSIEALMTIVPSNINMNKINKTKTNIMNKKMSILNKLVMFLNEVTEEAEAIVDVAVDDVTESGEVTLSYTLDSGEVVTVDSESIVRDSQLAPLAEGEYVLEDGNILIVDADSKFVETKAKDLPADEEKPVEAPIAQEDEEMKFTVTIDGAEYEVSEVVFDYIKKLEGEAKSTDEEIAQFKTKLAQLKSRIPSIKPVPATPRINQSKNTSVEASIANALSRLKK